ncbi:uncharacterized protein LOC116126503 [Pistacia vera]|uniref:uncharacterized protein LOC116126503 n=1 Tax=Pistacia vera TaxID=55513 RepID=UPI00126344A3|nr:uncharacterized protein LOC116126503 [Pistacia vera]
MERPDSDNERRRRLAVAKNKGVVVQCAPRRMLALPPPPLPVPAHPSNQAKLAAIAVDLNVRLRSADMPPSMQERVIRHARALLDSNADNKKLNNTHLSLCLKKEFDAVYGPAWHCIVGKSFGSFVTHSSGGFVYFSMDKLCFLLFKTEVRPVVKKSPLLLQFNT